VTHFTEGLEEVTENSMGKTPKIIHLLLSVDEPAGEDIAESLTGQFHKRFSEQFDLMIEGKGLDELKKYRSELISRGIAAGEIPDETFFGHYLFCIKDPDGNGITIYTSHAN
jgi:hypothetical protein